MCLEICTLVETWEAQCCPFTNFLQKKGMMEKLSCLKNMKDDL